MGSSNSSLRDEGMTTGGIEPHLLNTGAEPSDSSPDDEYMPCVGIEPDLLITGPEPSDSSTDDEYMPCAGIEADLLNTGPEPSDSLLLDEDMTSGGIEPDLLNTGPESWDRSAVDKDMTIDDLESALVSIFTQNISADGLNGLLITGSFRTKFLSVLKLPLPKEVRENGWRKYIVTLVVEERLDLVINTPISNRDRFRLIRMEAIYESNQGKLLAFNNQDKTFSLVDTLDNGFVPPLAMFPAPFSSFNKMLALRGHLRTTPGHRYDCYVKGELSQFIWHLEQDALHVQLRSPTPSVRHFLDEWNVVFDNSSGGGNDGDYCLAACDDGTVKWLRQFQCGNGNHVWKVHLFDSLSEERVHVRQRLRRRGANADNNQVNDEMHTIAWIPSDVTTIRKFLSPQDTFRLLEMEAIYINRGKLLAYTFADYTFYLTEIVGNGEIPIDAMLSSPYSTLLNRGRVTSRSVIQELFRRPDDDLVREELSTELSKYIWPFDHHDAIHVQFRSPEPSHSRMKVIFSSNGDGDDGDYHHPLYSRMKVGEYYLAACNDGTVKWQRRSKCRNGNHVWTVHLFDHLHMGKVHISQRVRRRGTNIQSGNVNNTYVGGNVNGPGGTQTTGSVSVQINN